MSWILRKSPPPLTLVRVWSTPLFLPEFRVGSGQPWLNVPQSNKWENLLDFMRTRDLPRMFLETKEMSNLIGEENNLSEITTQMLNNKFIFWAEQTLLISNHLKQTKTELCYAQQKFRFWNLKRTNKFEAHKYFTSNSFLKCNKIGN